MSTSIFGWIGTSITFIYKFPQIYKFYKKKTTDGVSIVSYVIQTIGYISYAIHGVIIGDDPCFAMGTISFFLNLILCCQYVYYNQHKSVNDIDSGIEI